MKMKKFENWDELKKSGSEEVGFATLQPGQYVVQIKEVTNIVEKEYLLIKFDIIYPKEFEGYFYQQMEKFGDWPGQGLDYWSYKETAQRFFTGKIIAIEKSNEGFVWKFDETQLVGKKFVANFGEEEYLNNEGNLKVSLKCREVRSTTAYKEGKIKDLKYKALPGNVKKEEVVHTVIEDDLPF